jgi:hypothetical protein
LIVTVRAQHERSLTRDHADDRALRGVTAGALEPRPDVTMSGERGNADIVLSSGRDSVLQVSDAVAEPALCQ